MSDGIRFPPRIQDEWQICVYCDKYKETRVWEETGEQVCYSCREDFIEQEHDDKIKELNKDFGINQPETETLDYHGF